MLVSAMETLIRNKYERKLYIRKGGEPPPNRNKDKEIKVCLSFLSCLCCVVVLYFYQTL